MLKPNRAEHQLTTTLGFNTLVIRGVSVMWQWRMLESY